MSFSDNFMHSLSVFTNTGRYLGCVYTKQVETLRAGK